MLVISKSQLDSFITNIADELGVSVEVIQDVVYRHLHFLSLLEVQ